MILRRRPALFMFIGGCGRIEPWGMVLQKIAVWRAIGAAYSFVFLEPLRLLRLGGVWMALFALVEVGAWLPDTSGSPTGSVLVLLVLGTFAVVILLFGGIFSFCVALHRAVLFGEMRPWFAALRFGKREWGFLGYSILVSILMALPLLPLELIAVSFVRKLGDILFFIKWSSAINIALTLIVWTYGCRMALVFPAIAADETGERLARAWGRSRGNGLRLYIGSVICVLPFSAVTLLARALLLPSLAEALRNKEDLFVALNRGKWLYEPIAFVMFFLALAVLVAFYSYCYLRLLPPASTALSPAPEADGGVAAPA